MLLLSSSFVRFILAEGPLDVKVEEPEDECELDGEVLICPEDISAGGNVGFLTELNMFLSKGSFFIIGALKSNS